MEEIVASNDLTIKIYPPTRATKEDEVVSNPDLDGLLEFLLGFAQEMLPAQSSFSPFGATVTDDSRIQPLAAYEGEHGSSQGHTDLLIEAIQAAAASGGIVAGGICTDVRVKPPDGISDAIQVHLEHRNGECVDVFLPYRRFTTGTFSYGPWRNAVRLRATVAGDCPLRYRQSASPAAVRVPSSATQQLHHRAA